MKSLYYYSKIVINNGEIKKYYKNGKNYKERLKKIHRKKKKRIKVHTKVNYIISLILVMLSPNQWT